MVKNLCMKIIVLTGAFTLSLGAVPTPQEIKDQQLVECKYPHCKKVATLGSAAHPFAYDVSKNPIPSDRMLGEIKAERRIQPTIPNKPGETIVYSIILTQGDLAGKELYIGFQNPPAVPGELSAKGTILDVALQYKGDGPRDWFEFHTLHVPTKRISFQKPDLLVKPDGTVIFVKGPDKQDVFDLSKLKKIKT